MQSTSFASCEPYFARDTLPRAISIMAGFRLKNRSKFSAIVLCELYVLMYMLKWYFVYKICGGFSSMGSRDINLGLVTGNWGVVTD